jgi:GNAT superfamily N-acetyltransferase
VSLRIRKLEKSDAEVISQAFAEIGWDKPVEQFERYCQQQQEGTAHVFVGEWMGNFAGYVMLNWNSEYQYFKEENIPVIQDLNVLPQYRRRRIASRLLDEAEATAATRRDRVGIGVGLHPGYNAAQRMYVLRGYVPDARGITSKGRYIQENERVVADDDLVLHLIKELRLRSDREGS